MTNLTLNAASGKNLSTKGSVTIEIDLGLGYAFTHKFIVVESLQVDVIIGLDLLRQGLTINCFDCKLESGIWSTPLFFGDLPSVELDCFCEEKLLDYDYRE